MKVTVAAGVTSDVWCWVCAVRHPYAARSAGFVQLVRVNSVAYACCHVCAGAARGAERAVLLAMLVLTEDVDSRLALELHAYLAELEAAASNQLL